MDQRINHWSKMAMWGSWRDPAGSAAKAGSPFLALALEPAPPPLARFVPFGGMTCHGGREQGDWDWAESQLQLDGIPKNWSTILGTTPKTIAPSTNERTFFLCRAPLGLCRAPLVLCRVGFCPSRFCAEIKFPKWFLRRDEIEFFTKCIGNQNSLAEQTWYR